MINESDLDKHNSSSNFYNDIFYVYTSDKGTDVTWKDRRNEFIENNLTLCEEICFVKDYNFSTGKATCSCPVKIESTPISEVKFNKTKLYNNFKNLTNTMNAKIMKCFDYVFSKEAIIKNIGFYITILTVLLHIVFIILFYIRDYKKIKSEVIKIININNDKKENKMKESKLEIKRADIKNNITIIKKVKKVKKKKIKKGKKNNLNVIKNEDEETIDKSLNINHIKIGKRNQKKN